MNSSGNITQTEMWANNESERRRERDEFLNKQKEYSQTTILLIVFYEKKKLYLEYLNVNNTIKMDA